MEEGPASQFGSLLRMKEAEVRLLYVHSHAPFAGFIPRPARILHWFAPVPPLFEHKHYCACSDVEIR